MPTVIRIDSGDHRGRVLAVRDELIRTHLHLVPPIARRIQQNLPPSFDIDDLIGEGNLGLWRAASCYQPATHGGCPFSAYARRRIRGAIGDSIRRRHFIAATHASLDSTEGDQSEGEWLAQPNTVDQTLDRAAALKRLARALEWLPPHQRRVLAKWHAEGQPTRKTAAWRRRLKVQRSVTEALQTLRVEYQRAA
jgi:RNA polymerase sigma factor (sigma-70 family)